MKSKVFGISGLSDRQKIRLDKRIQWIISLQYSRFLHYHMARLAVNNFPCHLLLCGIGNPVSFFWHDHLESRPLARLTGLCDRDAGNVKNLPGQGQTKPGMFTEAPVKDLFFFIGRDTIAIVFISDDHPAVGFMG